MQTTLKIAAAILLAATSYTVEAANPHFNGPVFSPDGQKIYYHQIGVGIWSMNPDGSGKTPILTENMNDRWVRFSQDGTKISFVSPMRGHPWSGYTANADGSDITLLESANTDNWQLGVAWLADGRLVYGEMVPFQKETQIQSLFLTDVNGENPVEIAKGVWPALSRDRSKILYGGQKKAKDGTLNHDVLVYDVETGTEHQLTDNPANEFSAVFSHDASKVYFIRADGDANWLMVMNADGSDPQPLGIAVQADSRPAASPDGKQLLFAKPNYVTQHLDIFQLDLETGNQLNLTAEHP